MRTKITKKGQVTIPKDLRIKLGLKTGDYLVIRETSEGYLLEKELDEKRFNQYVGFLKHAGDTDQVIQELRGE